MKYYENYFLQFICYLKFHHICVLSIYYIYFQITAFISGFAFICTTIIEKFFMVLIYVNINFFLILSAISSDYALLHH